MVESHMESPFWGGDLSKSVNLTITTGQPSCQNPKICDGCDNVITDMYILKVKARHVESYERYWHERCLKCCMCGNYMSDHCFERDGRYYCHDDYERLFADRCASCQRVIANLEMVMKTPTGHYFHIGCFRCTSCRVILNPGDMFSMNAERGWPYCQMHTASIPLGSPQSNFPTLNSRDHHSNSMPTMSYWSDEGNDDDIGGLKSDKRPRTVLSASQRKILKNAFSSDPKPSKKARQIMAMETGLSNRVVQVWFQNQRAKMKKRQRSSNSSTVLDSPLSHSEDLQTLGGGCSSEENHGSPLDHYVTIDQQKVIENSTGNSDPMVSPLSDEEMSQIVRQNEANPLSTGDHHHNAILANNRSQFCY